MPATGVKLNLLLFAAFLFLPSLAIAADLHLTSDTLIQSFKRDIPGEDGQQILPVYEYLQIDYGHLDSPGLSFHGYGWMRANLGDDYFEENTEAELLYAYLEYTPEARNYLIRLGRTNIYAGVANETVDGLYGQADILPSLSVSAYAGQPATLEDSEGGRSGDYIYGGRISHHRLSRYEAGLSYKALANGGGQDEEFLGLDLTVYLPYRMALSGISTRNLNSEGWAEHFYELRIPFGSFDIRPFYQHFSYENYFIEEDSSAFPFRFLAKTDNSIDVIGAEGYWYPNEQVEVGLKFKNYDYDSRFGSARYYSLVTAWKFAILSQVGIELGRMSGDEEENRYTMGRGFFYFDMRPLFVTADTVIVGYDEAIYDEDLSLFASLGMGYRMLGDRLHLKFSLDYMDDPYLDDNYRTMFIASYLYR